MILKDSEFEVVMNDINQVTIPSEMRRRYGISPKQRLILEIKGYVTEPKKNRYMPKVIKEDKKNE